MFKKFFSYLTDLLKWGCIADIFFLMYTFLRLIVSATRRRRAPPPPPSLGGGGATETTLFYYIKKFNIVSNEHRRRQKCDFCVSVCKTNFTDHRTPNTIHIFNEKVSSIYIPFHQAMQAIAMVTVWKQTIWKQTTSKCF